VLGGLENVRRFLYEFLTNLLHIALGYLAVRLGVAGLLIAAVFTAYEYLTSKNKGELFTDYLEFLMGMVVGLHRPL